MLRKIFIFTLLLSSAQWLVAQDSLQCQDIVYLAGGSVFRGKITRYDRSDMLEIVTWSGTKMQVPSNTVRRVVQKCYGGKVRKEREYSFSESGWYHNTRVAMLFGDIENGYSLQHSSGIKVNRFLSFGLGTGVENYGPGGNTPVTIPLFFEVRGYLTKRRIAPFYALGGGWSTIGKTQRNIDWWGGENNIENWKGGWLAQGQVGYRVGNHFTTFIGIRLQRLDLDWDNSVWSGGYGTNKYLKKRVEFGIGLLL